MTTRGIIRYCTRFSVKRLITQRVSLTVDLKLFSHVTMSYDQISHQYVIQLDSLSDNINTEENDRTQCSRELTETVYDMLYILVLTKYHVLKI